MQTSGFFVRYCCVLSVLYQCSVCFERSEGSSCSDNARQKHKGRGLGGTPTFMDSFLYTLFYCLGFLVGLEAESCGTPAGDN